MLKDRMEKWFRGEGGFYFGFHKNVGSLVGYPEDGFVCVRCMNDHHFHYGYWLMGGSAHREEGSGLADTKSVGSDGTAHRQRYRDQ